MQDWKVSPQPYCVSVYQNQIADAENIVFQMLDTCIELLWLLSASKTVNSFNGKLVMTFESIQNIYQLGDNMAHNISEHPVVHML